MLAALNDALTAHGMALRGGFAPNSGDGVPDIGPGQATRTVILIGNVGGAMWPAFAASGAATRYPTDPMDHWTQDVLEPVAAAFDARALYPFSGPPYYPFQRWAARAEPVHVSPLRIFIHPVFGLWHAYRAALLLPHALDLPAFRAAPSPCVTCETRPCLSTCPVGAFQESAFDDIACARHVDGPDGADCKEGGCLARRACPAGRDYSYPPPQMAFHMEAFLSRRR